MDLDEETIKKLRRMLPETTALVYSAGVPVGTAFFISADLLLTCAHVVDGEEVDGEEVAIQPYQRDCRPATVVKPDNPEHDLALLRSPLKGARPSPCAVLGEMLDSYDCLVAGYPRGDDGRLAARVLRVGVSPRTSPAGVPLELVLEPGQIITEGMSGGPVVSTETGTVIGVVRTSKNLEDPVGGGAIPISQAAEAFRQVREAQTGESLAMIRWRDILGQEKWARLHRPWAIGEQIDLLVKGSRNGWEVQIRLPSGKTIPHAGPALGERVAEAIFHWAQRRHMRGKDEVALLGQLLARALFPDPIPSDLAALGRADELLVRLHMPPGNDLGDIPWELTADPFSRFSGSLPRFLAAEPEFVFTRVVDQPAAPSDRTLAPMTGGSVLGVVAQPTTWTYSGAYGPGPDSAEQWTAELQHNVVAARFTFTPLAPPTLGNLFQVLHDGRYDVLHYMGTGRREPNNGEGQLVFVDEAGDVQWEDVHEVLDLAVHAGVRLVVLELLLPPEKPELSQLTYSKLGNVVPGTVDAAVLTNLPVHPHQCKEFNAGFYRSLGRGRTVESAAQEARLQLKHAKPVGDAAGFGWFTVVTGRNTPVVLAPPEPDPTVIGTRQTLPGGGGEHPEGADGDGYR